MKHEGKYDHIRRKAYVSKYMTNKIQTIQYFILPLWSNISETNCRIAMSTEKQIMQLRTRIAESKTTVDNGDWVNFS